MLPAMAANGRSWDMTAGAARQNGGRSGRLKRILTGVAIGREERRFATEQVRQYFEEALGVNSVRLSEAAAISKERIIAESAKASAELQLTIQRVADDFMNDVTGQFSANQLLQAEQASEHLRNLDASLAQGRMTPGQHAARRAAIEQIYDHVLACSGEVVSQMLQQSLDRIRNALQTRSPR